MKTEDPTTDTNSNDLGVWHESLRSASGEDWYQEFLHAESDRKRAYAASEWIREQGEILPVEGGEFLACDDDGIWQRDGEQELRVKLRAQLLERYDKSVLRKTSEQLLACGITNRDDFGTPPGKVAVDNGLLELQTGDIRPIEPEDRVLWKLPIEFNENAECPRFERTLDEWVPDREARNQLQEFVGYGLDFNNTDHDKMLMLTGPSRTGKSTFLSVINSLFGGLNNTSHISIQELAKSRWSVAELENTPVNIYHDLDSKDIARTGVVKQLASGEPMKAERKHQDPFTLRPRTKHLFSANRVPECTHADDAFYNRWLIIEFLQQRSKDDQDRELDEKLTTPSELSGILNWAIDGYRRLESQGKFTNEPESDEARGMWRNNGGSIERFIQNHVKRAPDAHVQKDLMYAEYQEFAESRDAVIQSKSKLSKK